MRIIKFIQNDYQEKVALMDCNTELKRALKTHERIPVFFDNLEKALLVKKNLTREQIKLATYDMTEIFVRNFERQANERIMSEAAKNAIIDKVEDDKKKQAWLDRVDKTGVIDDWEYEKDDETYYKEKQKEARQGKEDESQFWKLYQKENGATSD